MNTIESSSFSPASKVPVAPVRGGVGAGQKEPPTSNKGGSLHFPPHQDWEGLEAWASEHGCKVEYKFDWLNVVFPHPLDMSKIFDGERNVEAQDLKQLYGLSSQQRAALYRDWEIKSLPASVPHFEGWDRYGIKLNELSDVQALGLYREWAFFQNKFRRLFDIDIDKRGDYDLLNLDMCLPLDLPLTVTEKRAMPFQGYNRAFYLLPAGKICYHSKRPENGILLSFSGSDLDKLREINIDIRALMLWFASELAVTTRLDCAIDVFNAGSMLDVIKAFEEHEQYLDLPRGKRDDIPLHQRGVVTKAVKPASLIVHPWRYEGTSRRAYTVYLGTVHSHRRLRIYDKYEEVLEKQQKAARLYEKYNKMSDEQKAMHGVIPDCPLIPEDVKSWLRIELSLKKEYATPVTHSLAENGIGQVISAAIADFVQIPLLDWFMYAIAVPRRSIVVEKIRRVVGSTETWVLTQVMPALFKLIDSGSIISRGLVADLASHLRRYENEMLASALGGSS